MNENIKKPATKRRGKFVAAALIALTGFGVFGSTAHAATIADQAPQTESVVVVKAKPPVTNAFGVRW